MRTLPSVKLEEQLHTLTVQNKLCKVLACGDFTRLRDALDNVTDERGDELDLRSRRSPVEKDPVKFVADELGHKLDIASITRYLGGFGDLR